MLKIKLFLYEKHVFPLLHPVYTAEFFVDSSTGYGLVCEDQFFSYCLHYSLNCHAIHAFICLASTLAVLHPCWLAYTPFCLHLDLSLVESIPSLKQLFDPLCSPWNPSGPLCPICQPTLLPVYKHYVPCPLSWMPFNDDLPLYHTMLWWPSFQSVPFPTAV
jgi:hypothetical protein